MSNRMKTPSVKMKDSGIDWIGEIPEHWDIRKLSHICETITDFTASGSFADLAANVKYLDTEDYARLIRTADLSGKREVKPVYINEHAYNYLNNSNLFGGEIILPNVGSIGEVYLYKPLYKRASLAPNSIMLRSFGSNKYLYYLFYTKQFGDFIKLESSSTAQGKFNKTQLRAVKIPYPPTEEQRLIAVQLNQICGTLDNTKADIEKQIEILNEYKKSVITEAVTKGLDKNVELKDSGIDYIGHYPKSWTIKRLKYVLTERNQRSKTGEEKLLSVSQYYGVIFSSQNKNKTMQAKTLIDYKKVFRNDLVFNKLNPALARFGKSDYDGITSPDYSVYIVNNDVCDTKFLEYILKTDKYAIEYGRLTLGVGDAFRRLYTNQLGNIYVALPKLEEQQRILKYLTEQCSEIDSIIESKKQQLELLEEYKKSIIYEYATGKRSVTIESAGDFNRE